MLPFDSKSQRLVDSIVDRDVVDVDDDDDGDDVTLPESQLDLVDRMISWSFMLISFFLFRRRKHSVSFPVTDEQY